MRTIQFWPIAAACAAACAIPVTGWAQQAADNAQPPQLEKLEEGEVPAVTISKPGQDSSITEKRVRGGRVTEITVTNGNNTYYLKPNTPASGAAYEDGQSNSARPAQWRVMQFDLNRSKEAQEAQAAEAAKTPPPPAPSSPEKK